MQYLPGKRMGVAGGWRRIPALHHLSAAASDGVGQIRRKLHCGHRGGRRAALTACWMAARRIVGRPDRRWRTRLRAQRVVGVRERRHGRPAAGKSALPSPPGLWWWRRRRVGFCAHHCESVSVGGRRRIRAPSFQAMASKWSARESQNKSQQNINKQDPRQYTAKKHS